MEALDAVENWIREHGADSVLSDHVARLKEQVTALENEARALREEVARLTTGQVAAEEERGEMKRECEDLQTSVRKLKRRQRGL